MTRRSFLHRTTVAGAGLALASTPLGRAANARSIRSFHLCLAPDVVLEDTGLVETVGRAGIGTIWLAGFLYGHRPYSDDVLRRARAAVERAGMASELITVPLGHPGNSLGKPDGNTPPGHWSLAQRPDGTEFSGTSLHAPATEENTAALQHLRGFGFRRCFLDDDFRLARSPGEIGGCFCPRHRDRFLKLHGFGAREWASLLDDVAKRRLTPLLDSWTEFTCDELTASFRTQRRAFRGDLGIMVMYLGAEKAGIRLRDYRSVPVRVGELMFDDTSFGPLKGKTDELFSVLFHRRFAAPENAYSETTAYPADRLSAAHMAAKMVLSTIADVRHTMFMSGLTPFPRTHWDVLTPAMRQQSALHAAVAGHRPRGPFKHYWGEAQRRVGDDRPFSLWLAAGVPFEVVDRPPSDGWTFLSDFDALARERVMRAGSSSTRWVCRSSAVAHPPGADKLAETLPEIFAFKRRIRDRLRDVPHVDEDQPAVCAWYPEVRRVLVWNPTPEPRALTVVWGSRRHTLPLGPLEAGMVDVA